MENHIRSREKKRRQEVKTTVDGNSSERNRDFLDSTPGSVDLLREEPGPGFI